jgi:DNA-binding phage protein
VTVPPARHTETRKLRVSRALLDVALDRAGRPFDAVPRLRTPGDVEAWLAKIVAASERPPAALARAVRSAVARRRE